VIKLVRHGQSTGNANGHNNAEHADHALELTDKGRQQAQDAGRLIGKQFIESALVYTSPYTRARQTCDNVILGAGATVQRRYEDPRLREVEHGYGDVAMQDQEALKNIHGAFYYRFSGGESPADCYDRICTFLESLKRQIQRKETSNVLVVSHGITIRCFVMRYLHLQTEDFGKLRNPWNGDVITIGNREEVPEPQFVSGGWAVTGLKFR
jgi:broad specificity phosphatase PhoE